jgi:predicted YcjX-like family ATPase
VAIRDLESTLAAILDCFRTGRAGFLSTIFRPRIDRILFAATKADHLHHTSHDRLERILARMTERASQRARFLGAQVDVVALAAVRATREAQIGRGPLALPAIVGTPIAGETAGAEVFDGESEIAVFPGDLPEDPETMFAEHGPGFRGLVGTQAQDADYRFVRFRPPPPRSDGTGFPHIRLDRALQFLLGDKLE